jgi:PQQ-dependent catabolism-associated beta-propeller protein
MRPRSMTTAALAALALAGALPTAQAQTGLAIVSSEKDHALTLIDTKTLAVAGSIATCKRPRHMRKSVDGKQLLVACGDSGQADVIDLASKKSVGRIALGDDPEIFDLSLDGKLLYVSNEEDAELGVIEVATGKRIAAVKVGAEPEGVIVAPDGRLVYVSSEVASMVHVVDAATRKVVKNIAVGKRPRRFAFAAGGAELWVTNELGASVSVIDTRTQAVVKTINFELKGMRGDDISPVDLKPSPDGKTMYVGLGRANHVAFVDAASKSVRALVLVGKRAWGLGLNGDGSRLWVANGLSDDVTVIDTAAARALKTLPAGRVPHSVLVID